MPPISDLILFITLALVAIVSALGMLFSRNSVYAALFLVMNFSTIAIFYLILGAPFIAMAQITVYAGAIMVLFLFVIMLLGAELTESTETLPWQRPLAFLLGVVLVVEAAYVIMFRSGIVPEVETVAEDFGSPWMIGEMLFNEFLLPFEVTSIVLLTAMIGAIILTQRRIQVDRKAGRGVL